MPIINKINLASFNSKYGTEGGVNLDGSENKEIRDSTPYSISRYFIIMNVSWKSSYKTTEVNISDQQASSPESLFPLSPSSMSGSYVSEILCNNLKTYGKIFLIDLYLHTYIISI